MYFGMCILSAYMEGWEMVFQDSAETNLSLLAAAEGFLQSVAVWLDWF